VKKNVLLVLVLMLAVSVVSCAKPDYKKLTNDFILNTTQMKDFEIRGVEDTSSSDWKAVIVYSRQGSAKVPILILVSADGKSFVANSMVFVGYKPVYTKKLEPEFGKIDFKLADKDRIVYNPAGTKPIIMFTDPDCPFCKKAKEKLQSYNGEYRVVVKYFPLEQIHPGATQKAIGEVADWLKKTRPDLKGADILKEAQNMVEEDIIEAQKVGIGGVPSYIMEDGTMRQGLF